MSTKFPWSEEKKSSDLNEVGVSRGVSKSAADRPWKVYCTRSRNAGMVDAKSTWPTKTSSVAERIAASLGTTGCPVIPSRGNVRKVRNSGRLAFELSSPKRTSEGLVVTVKVFKTGSNSISPSDARSLKIFTVAEPAAGDAYVTVRSGAVEAVVSSMPTRPGPVMTTTCPPPPPQEETAPVTDRQMRMIFII